MFNTSLPTVNELPSTRKLVRSTVIAILVAVALLVTVVMPSEYAIDPTGVGRTLGLTQMGELKIILAQEALADAAPLQPAAPTPAPQVAKVQPIAKPVATPAPTLKTDQMTVTLKPGEGKEIKLNVLKGKTVTYNHCGSETAGPRLGLAEQPHTKTLRGASNVQTKAIACCGLDDLWCRAGS